MASSYLQTVQTVFGFNRLWNLNPDIVVTIETFRYIHIQLTKGQAQESILYKLEHTLRFQIYHS